MHHHFALRLFAPIEFELSAMLLARLAGFVVEDRPISARTTTGASATDFVEWNVVDPEVLVAAGADCRSPLGAGMLPANVWNQICTSTASHKRQRVVTRDAA